MRYFVIGGAGYIGSHFIRIASEQSHDVMAYDNLSRGHRRAVPEQIPFVHADILDQARLTEELEKFKPDAVLHFAALALVGESVANPDMYFRNNVQGVYSLLEAMRNAVPEASLVFSSSCAVFGVPQKLPICEDDEKKPVSPYGRSKLIAEFLIEDYCQAYGLRAMALRYFNACGAHSSGTLGEDHEPETHLIPNIIKAARAGKEVTIFGNDFPTRDGTCVRDYIHVEDLVEAHLLAAGWLSRREKGAFTPVHLGTGNGLSNLEICRATGEVMGQEIGVTFGPRRPGDPPELYADNTRAKELLGFTPQVSGPEHILSTALKWHQNFPDGYKGAP